jgi:ABC-2 type transport system permease protein
VSSGPTRREGLASGLSPGLVPTLLGLNARIELRYSGQFAVRLLTTVTRVVLFYLLWSAVYPPGGVTAGLDVHQAITFSTLAAFLEWRRLTSTESLAVRIRTGTVLCLFLRPVSPARYYLVEGVGNVLYGMTWLLLGGAVALASGLILPPPNPATLGLFLLSVFLGGLLDYHLFMLVDLSSFWFIQTNGIEILYGFAVQFLSGLLVPVWFFPDWLRTVALALPFQAAGNVPLSLYVGRIHGADVWPAVALQIGWVAALALLVQATWRRAERRVIVQGG